MIVEKILWLHGLQTINAIRTFCESHWKRPQYESNINIQSLQRTTLVFETYEYQNRYKNQTKLSSKCDADAVSAKLSAMTSI